MIGHDKPENEKIVLDTSVWIAKTLAPGGAGDAAIKKALENYIPVGSRETMAELERKLIQDPPEAMAKKGIPLDERVQVLEEAKAITKIVEATNKQELCRDPKDNMFIQLAMDSGAKQIVTFDKDLSVLNRVQGVQTYKAKDFLQRERELDPKRAVFLSYEPPKFDPKHAREELTPATAVQPEPQRQQASRPPTFDPKYAREEIAPARKPQPEPSRERQVQPPPQPERPKPAIEPQREIPSRRRDYEREL